MEMMQLSADEERYKNEAAFIVQGFVLFMNAEIVLKFA